MKLMALTRNGQARPAATISTPPSAGPMARLMFMPTACRAMADCSSGRGTSCGMIACHAGDSSAVQQPIAKVMPSSSGAVIAPVHTIAPSSAASPSISAWVAICRRRLSKRSASVPAGSASRNTGAEVAACTSTTIAGDGVSVVISQPAAASCIHEPMLDTSAAAHSTAKSRCRSGLQALAADNAYSPSVTNTR